MRRRTRQRSLGQPRAARGALVAVVIFAALAGAGYVAAGRMLNRRVVAVATATPTPTPEAVSELPVTYVVVGASDAFGIGTDDPAHDAWPTAVARRLSSNTHLVNLGIPGATVEMALRDEAPIALASKPDVITVWLGINDFDQGVSLDAFAQRLATLLTTLADGTGARIYVANLPDLTLLPYFNSRPAAPLQQAVSEWNQRIAAAAQQAGATLVNVFDDFAELAQHPEYLNKDGLHPSTAGASRLAQIFLAAVEGTVP